MNIGLKTILRGALASLVLLLICGGGIYFFLWLETIFGKYAIGFGVPFVMGTVLFSLLFYPTESELKKLDKEN